MLIVTDSVGRPGGLRLPTMPYRVLPILAALLLAPAAFPVSASSEEAQFIQPGSEVETPVGFCTLNFVFRKPSTGELFIGTAGHCVEGTNGRVKTEGVAWGTVVLDVDADTDFALIRIDSNRYSSVRPAVRHWGGPVGSTVASETQIGSQVVFFGYGMGFGSAETSRPRQGVLIGDSPDDYTADTLAVFGDSGGPLLHKPTGKALGIISSFNVPISTDAGPTMQHILGALAARGWNLQLQTAPFGGQIV